jgi:hypothetical protein
MKFLLMEIKDWIQIVSIFVSPFLALLVNDKVHKNKENRELQTRKERLRLNTVKEINFDISILEDLEKQHKKLKEYFQNNLWENCFEYFRFTRILFLSFNKIIEEGFLYDFLENEDILKLDALMSTYNLSMENWCNNEVKRYKQLLSENPNDKDIRSEAWGALEYRLGEIEKHKKYFQDLKKKLNY